MLLLLSLILSVSVAEICCQSRIVGGQNAKRGEFPYLAAIERNKKLHCGGSIISKIYILTAAHCTERILPSELKVIVGTTDLKSSDAYVVGVKDIIDHPRYDTRTDNFDAALLKL